jgi:hypothetical protein
MEYLVLVEEPSGLVGFSAETPEEVELIRAAYDPDITTMPVPYTLRVLSRPDNGTVYRDFGVKDSRVLTPEG